MLKIINQVLGIPGRFVNIAVAFTAGFNWCVLQSTDGDVGPWDYVWRVGLLMLVLLVIATLEGIRDALSLCVQWRSRNSLSQRGEVVTSTADVDSIAALAESKVRSGDIDGLKRVIELAQHEKHRGAGA